MEQSRHQRKLEIQSQTARTFTATLSTEYPVKRPDGKEILSHERDAIENEITELGLKHKLMTRFTSFVAVAKAVVNPGGRANSIDVEVPRVAGVPDSAYPASALSRDLGPTPTPDPKDWLDLVIYINDKEVKAVVGGTNKGYILFSRLPND